MANGMGCYFHPEEQAVALCKKCGKGICGSCVDAYSKPGSKYSGLCRNCVLEAGIPCNDHSSKQASAYCEECGLPICDDLIHSKNTCYMCTTNLVNDEIAWCKHREKIDDIKWKLVIVFSAIGVLLFLPLGIETVAQGWYNIPIAIWIGIGIGGNLRVAISEVPGFFRMNREKGETFLASVGYTLAFFVLMLLLKALAGPIIPLLKIFEYRKNVKTAKSTIADNTDFLGKMEDYRMYTQYVERYGDKADVAKQIDQGGALYNNSYAKAVIDGTRETYWEDSKDE